MKLREAALAYHLTRKWSKERILRNYLNTIYFGNGAYGIESAAQTYFGARPPRLRERQGSARARRSWSRTEAALLAGMVASPSGVRPDRSTPRPPARAATSCSSACSSRASSRASQYDRARGESAPDARGHPAARARTPSTRTSRRGSSSRSSTSSAAASSARAAPSRAA